MDIKEIQNLIKFVAKSGASEVKLEMEDVKITIRTGAGKTETTAVSSSPMAANASSGSSSCSSAVASEAALQPQKLPQRMKTIMITIKSPIIGTFYRKPSPDKPNFVEVGSE